MSKKLQRKKPGYTKAGIVKIVSLSLNQLNKLIAETSKTKVKAKIQRRIHNLIARKGLPKPDVTVTEVMESVAE
jgi:hypothetical protein